MPSGAASGRIKQNEALLNVSVQRTLLRGLSPLPQVHYGFDRAGFQAHAQDLWLQLPATNGLPGLGALKSILLPQYRVHGVLLRIPEQGMDLQISHLGLAVAKMARVQRKFGTDYEVPHDSILARIPSYFDRVRRLRRPVLFDDLAAVGFEGGETYNGILLPFGEEHGEPTHLFAIIDSNEADQQTGEDVLELTSEYSNDDLGQFEMTDDLDNSLDLLLSQIVTADADDAVDEIPIERDAHRSLAWCLEKAQQSAEFAKASEGRTRKALYAAIGEAYDLALAAVEAPDAYAELIEASGLTVQERAPMVPVIKLAFGKDYDRKRISEYAAVLAYARHREVARGELTALLENAENGIKGIVAEMRRLRNGSIPRKPVRRMRRSTLKKLRELPARAMAELELDNEEFALVMVRRMANGELVMVGEATNNAATLERVAKELMAAGSEPYSGEGRIPVVYG